MSADDLLLITRRDEELVVAAALWIDTVRNSRGSAGLGYGATWTPTHADVAKSRLFWRIRSGKAPLPEPPPRAFSCPWYEVIEELVPHRNQEVFELTSDYGMGTGVVVNQCKYELIERWADGSLIIGFGNWRFRTWEMSEAELAGRPLAPWRHWIQRMPELELPAP